MNARSPVVTDPRAEEAAARHRLRNAEKGRKARQAKVDSERWQRVRDRQKRSGCKCELRPGMSAHELADLGSGCTAHRHFVCPTLDLYRRLVGRAG